jgi:hypothetical protein
MDLQFQAHSALESKFDFRLISGLENADIPQLPFLARRARLDESRHPALDIR